MPSKKSSQSTQARRLPKPRHKSFRITRRKIRQPKPPLTSAPRVFWRSLSVMRKHWKEFSIVALVYLLVTVVLVRGLEVTIGAADIKEAVTELFGGDVSNVLVSFTVLGALLGSNTVNGEAASVYQGLLLIIHSLAFIWVLRHIWATKNVDIQARDAFYQGMYPLIPFILVLFVIGLQLVPLYLASFLSSIVFGAGIAVTALEQVLWALLLILLVLLSAYWLTASVFALFIVSLPKSRPIQSLRAAGELVAHRRMMVMRKVLFLPLALGLVLVLVMLPLIMLSPSVAEWVFIVLSAFTLPVSLTYLYTIYRELL